MGIIIDGQREWADRNQKSHIDGYFLGMEKLFQWMFDPTNTIKGVTVLDVDKEELLTENYCRNNPEFVVKLNEFIEIQSELLMDNGWNVRILGYLNSIDKRIRKILIDLESLNKAENQKCLQLCVNYSGRNEIIRAMRLLKKRGLSMTMDNFENCLDSSVDIDLILRTGGSSQIKQFLIWQSADSYIQTTKTLWPEVDYKVFDNAVSYYLEQKKKSHNSL
ncbi:hypothetical protein HC766_00595 [Candidatus Gracilibacteria bacterium]|nr:hypothetical protein [Candidatus Gracilibacteria bacterium]